MNRIVHATDLLTRRFLTVLALFTVTFFVYRDFDIRMIYGFGVLGLLVAANLFCRLAQNLPPVIDTLKLSFLILVGTVLVNFLRPNSRHDADSVSFIISMLICAAMVVLCRPSWREGRAVLRICFWGAVFMTAFVLFFLIFEDLFWDTFYHILSPTAQAYLRRYIPKGYSFSLGGCTFTNYVLYLGISVCCAWAAVRKFDRQSMLALAAAAVFLLALLVVGRRGELLGAIICLGLLVLALCNRRQRRWLIFLGILGCIALFGLLVLLRPLIWQVPALYRYALTLEKLLHGQDITSGRVELYVIALRLLGSHPLFGIGWDKFYLYIPQWFLNSHGQDVEDVHCIYLQFFAETGLVGAPFLIAPLMYNYYLVCTQFSRLKTQRETMTRALLLCIASFMIQSFLLVLGIYDPNFQRVVFWCFYALALVLQLGAQQLEQHTPTDPVSRWLTKLIIQYTPAFSRVWDWAAGLFRPLRGDDPV